MTADYDTLLEEPEYETCQDHGEILPCAACLADAADRAYDSQREEGRDGTAIARG